MKYLVLMLSFFLVLINQNKFNTFCYADKPKVFMSNNVYISDLNLASKLSKETQQNIVLIFSASWCHYCQTLKNDLPTIAGFDNKIICILDVDENKKLAKQFKVKTMPTSIILKNNQELSRISGYENTSYTKWLKDY